MTAPMSRKATPRKPAAPKVTPPKSKEPPDLTPMEKSLLDGVQFDDKPLEEDQIVEYRKGILVKPLTKLYVNLGMFMVMPFDAQCGKAVVVNAENMAKSLDELAQQNKAVRDVLMKVVKTSVWGTVIAAHLPLLITIMMHHVPAFQERTSELAKTIAEQQERERME